MKFILFLLCFLYTVIVIAQPSLEPYFYEDSEQTYVIKEYTKYKRINNPEMLLPQKWTIVNISYLDIINPQDFDPFCKKTFLKGLRNDTLVAAIAVHHIIDLVTKRLLIWSAFTGNKCEEIKHSLYNPGMYVEFYNLFEYVSNEYSERMVPSVFVIDPLYDIFVVCDNVVYVYCEGKFIEATTYLRKKYKSKVEFMKKVGYKLR